MGTKVIDGQFTKIYIEQFSIVIVRRRGSNLYLFI